jgi:hypothetical protein
VPRVSPDAYDLLQVVIRPAARTPRPVAESRSDLEFFMRRRRPRSFCLARHGWALFLPFALGSSAIARVIQVGPQREVTTINAAVARAKVGDEIVLDRATEYPTDGVKVTVDAIEIRSAEGPEAPAIIRNTSTSKSPTTIEHRGEGLVLKDLVMSGSGGVTCILAKGRRLTIDSVKPAASIWRFVHLDGAQQTVIRHCDVPLLNDYNVCSFGGETRGLVMERCTFGGSTDEHCVRLQRIHDARLRDCTFNAGGKKSALTVRDGANVRVDNCVINGPIAIGPLADGDGGINLPTGTVAERARREALLRRTALDYTFQNCTITTNGITVEMGVQRLTFQACWIKTAKQWILRLNKDQYETWRCVPTGQLVHCELNGPAGLRPFENKRPDFHVIGTIINGVRLPDTGTPATQPGSGGGAVPGEVPSTHPTPAPATQAGGELTVRPEDVLSAVNRLDDAIALLGVARDRLRSSTQPSELGSP